MRTFPRSSLLRPSLFPQLQAAIFAKLRAAILAQLVAADARRVRADQQHGNEPLRRPFAPARDNAAKSVVELETRIGLDLAPHAKLDLAAVKVGRDLERDEALFEPCANLIDARLRFRAVEPQPAEHPRALSLLPGLQPGRHRLDAAAGAGKLRARAAGDRA